MAAPPIRVLIADAHPIVRQGLRTFLTSRPGLEVVGEAADGEAALVEAARLGPDVVLLDLVMPRGGGVDVIRRLRTVGERVPEPHEDVEDRDLAVYYAITEPTTDGSSSTPPSCTVRMAASRSAGGTSFRR